MPTKPAYHRDISGRIAFPAGYEPSATELLDAAKDGFPRHRPSQVIVVILGKRKPTAARLRLQPHTTTLHWADYAPEDRPSAEELMERAKDSFPMHHPSQVHVCIYKDRSVSNQLTVGLTIPSIGIP